MSAAPDAVLDASALLAWLQDEPGAARVADVLEGAAICSVNWSEVAQKLRQHGRSWPAARALLDDFELVFVDADRRLAEAAAAMWQVGSPLSLGDRFCLGTGASLGLPVYTADTSWGGGAGIVQLR